MKNIKYRIFDTVVLNQTIVIQDIKIKEGTFGVIKGYDFENRIYSVLFDGQLTSLWGAIEDDLELVEKVEINEGMIYDNKN